jgi:hypothetical protein
MAKKKIAVLVRDRQSEALRMAVGLILLDDQIDVYVLDRPLPREDDIQLYVETLHDLEMNGYTNFAANSDLEFLPTEEIARRLPDYDQVLPY